MAIGVIPVTFTATVKVEDCGAPADLGLMTLARGYGDDGGQGS